ncbi:metallophosphoesterase [Fulvivirgaceae bacterium BMA12]|uniref:Metallophosphoesterase n=1 Tax=Agaribacillus aureus TaxID=3051825 RepID=A0ABT8LAI7_9BACT|nr:metallophosphoesterase [Fulvivirgaceae bacterium BMA12]
MPYQTKKPYFTLAVLVAVICYLPCCQPGKSPEIAKIDQSGKLNPWTNLDWNNDPTNFQFVIVTDRTGGERPGIFEEGVEKVNLLQPEFVMSVGDLIQGYTEDVDQIKSQWEEFDEFVSRLEMPFFYVAGNHDITNQVMEDIWKERLGATYYHFVYHNVLFLCLNSEEGLDAHRSSFFSEQQRSYVKETLAANPEVRWTMVFLHKPVWLAEERSDDHKQEVEKSGWKEIESMLQGRKHTVFAGHIHRYTHRERSNSDYITLATTGGGSKLGGPVFGQFDHVMWVTMTEEGPIMANLLLEGIWDEDFSREDVEKYLKMNLQRKAVRIESHLDDDKPLINESIDIRLVNSHEVPMTVTVSFDKSEHISFSPEKVEKVIPPNAVEKVTVQLQVEGQPGQGTKDDTEWSKLWEELDEMPARWEITYDFEDYGKIAINGSASVL